jgi:hypothetical protein
MAVDYVQMLRDLVEERESWSRKRDDAERQLARLSELIRATMKMLPPARRAECEHLFERIDHRPVGMTIAIRRCFTFGKEWLTPVEIRDALKTAGFPFDHYQANPLASIHTTLKRLTPGEMEVKTLPGGQKAYRLKSVAEWKDAFTEIRKFLAENYSVSSSSRAGHVLAVERPAKHRAKEKNRS